MRSETHTVFPAPPHHVTCEGDHQRDGASYGEGRDGGAGVTHLSVVLTLKTLKWALTMDRGLAFALCSSVADDNTGPSEQGVALLELLQASGPALLLLEQRLCPHLGAAVRSFVEGTALSWSHLWVAAPSFLHFLHHKTDVQLPNSPISLGSSSEAQDPCFPSGHHALVLKLSAQLISNFTSLSKTRLGLPSVDTAGRGHRMGVGPGAKLGAKGSRTLAHICPPFLGS